MRIDLGNGMTMDRDSMLRLLRAGALPVGTKVEIVPHQPDSTWPGGVGTIVEICPQQGGYLVQHPAGTCGWCWDEVVRARPWWKRLLSKHPKREAQCLSDS